MSDEIEKLMELVEHWRGEAEIQFNARMKSEEALRLAEEREAIAKRERDEAIALNRAASLLLNKEWEKAK